MGGVQREQGKRERLCATITSSVSDTARGREKRGGRTDDAEYPGPGADGLGEDDDRGGAQGRGQREQLGEHDEHGEREPAVPEADGGVAPGGLYPVRDLGWGGDQRRRCEGNGGLGARDEGRRHAARDGGRGRCAR